MTRPIYAHVNLDALKHNYLLAKEANQGPALAVLKANAYGHGAVACAQALSPIADGFAVASLEEARQLRNAQITQPILLLEGFFDAEELAEIAALECWVVVHDAWQVDALCAAQFKAQTQVWLKVNTGMHRLGLTPAEVPQAYQALSNCPQVDQVALMTHFANADAIDKSDVKAQIRQFEETANALSFDGLISLSNSAAILSGVGLKNLNQSSSNWVRPGLMLYGADPLYANIEKDNNVQPLQTVMTLQAKLIAVKTLQAGDAIGYGSLFKADVTMRVGVVACGYADGYPRTAMQAPVAVDGVQTTTLGRVSMDMLYVDLRDLPEAAIGSVVELWGEQVSVDAVASAANTLSYELLCNVKRVQFTYS